MRDIDEKDLTKFADFSELEDDGFWQDATKQSCQIQGVYIDVFSTMFIRSWSDVM
jgi:hypothetical protein